MARTSAAHLQRPVDLSTGEQRLFQMGANATRTSYKKDPVSGLYLPGVLLEPQAINYNKRSEDFGNAWIPNNMGVNLNAETAPNGEATADVLTETSATAGHYYRILLDIGNLNAIATASVYCKDMTSGITRYPHLYWNCVGDAHVTFNLSTGAIANFDDRADFAKVHDLGNGLYRLQCTSQIDYTGARNIAWGACDDMDGDGNPSYTGSAGATTFMYWGMQVEITPYPSSYIPTVSSAVTRTADSALVWTLGSEMANKEWTLLAPVCVPAHTPASNLKLLTIYKNGAAATDHVTLWADTSKRAYLTSAATGKSAGAVTVTSSDICDGEIHWVSIHARDGQLHCFVQSNDGQYHAADLDAGIAPDLDRFSIEPSGGWVGGVQMEMKFRPRMPRPVQPQLLAA